MKNTFNREQMNGIRINQETEELLQQSTEEVEKELESLDEKKYDESELNDEINKMDLPQDQLALRTMTRGVYDLQKLRIMTGNRIVTQFKDRLGLAPSQKEKELDEKEKKVLDELRSQYKKITDGIAILSSEKAMDRVKDNKIISSFTELVLLENYFSLEAREEKSFRQIATSLSEFDIYNKFLKDVRGVGPAMAGVLVSEIDIRKATYVSSLWAYTGLDVAPDGKGRSMRKEHMVEVQYKDKNGEIKTKMSITFKPHLKAKMIGVLAPSFLRSASPYASCYYNYKNRITNHPEHKDKSKGHIHNMSLRYMIKRFYVDLYVNWRECAGLEVYPEYSEAKLGMVHHKGE